MTFEADQVRRQERKTADAQRKNTQAAAREQQQAARKR